MAKMTEQDYQIIDKIEQTGNITRAADQLFVTQSALSKRIAAIEQELGVPLLIRSRQGVRFTPQGETVLHHVRKVLKELSDMKTELEVSKDIVSGTLKAGISINYAQYTLPDVLSSFRTAYPHVSTHISTGQSRHLYRHLLEGQLDVVILRGEYEWKEGRILLSREKICAICSREDSGKPLCEIPYIGRGTDSAFERELLQWIRENNLQSVQNGIHVDSITTCVEMVTRGLGWAVVPEICLREFEGDIRPLVFRNGEPFVRSTYLLYPDEAANLPQVQAFIDTIRKEQG